MTPSRLANPLPLNALESDEAFNIEFHRRQRRSSWHAILDWLGEPELAQEARNGLLDNPDWSERT